MTESRMTVLLLWVNHCHPPDKGAYSIWVVPGGDSMACSDVLARRRGICVFGPSRDLNACRQLHTSMEQIFEMIGVTVHSEETADD